MALHEQMRQVNLAALHDDVNDLLIVLDFGVDELDNLVRQPAFLELPHELDLIHHRLEQGWVRINAHLQQSQRTVGIRR